MGGWQFTFIQHKEAGEIEFSQYIAPVIGALGEMGVSAAFNGRNDLTIDGKKLVLEQPIKSFGSYEVKAKLGYEVSGTVYVLVIEEK